MLAHNIYNDFAHLCGSLEYLSVPDFSPGYVVGYLVISLVMYLYAVSATRVVKWNLDDLDNDLERQHIGVNSTTQTIYCGMCSLPNLCFSFGHIVDA